MDFPDDIKMSNVFCAIFCLPSISQFLMPIHILNVQNFQKLSTFNQVIISRGQFNFFLKSYHLFECYAKHFPRITLASCLHELIFLTHFTEEGTVVQ